MFHFIKDTSEVVLPQNDQLEMEKRKSIPKTNPLPRSGQTKITGIAYNNNTRVMQIIKGVSLASLTDSGSYNKSHYQ